VSMTDRAALTAQIAELQARLAAMDTVDPLLIEAREIAAKFSRLVAPAVLQGNYDGGDYVRIALAALRRGMELARVPVASWPDDAEIADIAHEILEERQIIDTEFQLLVRMARRLKARILPAGEQSA